MRATLKIKVEEQQAVRHNLDLHNHIQVEKLIRRVAEQLEIGTSIVTVALAELTEALEDYRINEIEKQTHAQDKRKFLTPGEVKAAQLYLSSPNLVERTREDIGKTHLQEKVSALIPEEDKLEITSLSGNAFYYFGQQELRHKLILIEDLDGAATFIDPDGNIINVRDDGDRSIYLVHDLENWDGSKGGLAVVGATPEPATLKNFVGQNLYSERVAGYMFQEAERLNHEAWLLAWNKTKAMGELLKSRDEQLRIIEQIKSLNREQMITLLRILKAKELLQHVEKGKGDILNWIGIRTLLNILASQGKNINLPGDTAGDFIMPDDKIYEKALEHRELEKQIIERYDKMINDIQNRN